MAYCTKKWCQGLGTPFLIWLVLNLHCDVALGRVKLPQTYFGGYDYYDVLTFTNCTESQYTECQEVCQGNNLAACYPPFSRRYASYVCFCHTAPGTAPDKECEGPVPVDAGTEISASDDTSEGTCLISGQQKYRSRTNVFTCADDENQENFCVVQDFLAEIQTSGSFGGKDVLFDCRSEDVDYCKLFCGDNFELCVFSEDADLKPCFCHDNPPRNDVQMYGMTYSCTKIGTVSPSDPQTGGESLSDKCLDFAVGFKRDIDVYTCAGQWTGTACILIDHPPPCGCDACSCESGDLLLSLLCPVICTAIQIVGFVRDLIKDVVLETLGKLLDSITDIVEGVLDSIGGLLE